VEACQADFVANVWRNEVDEGVVPFYILITDGAGCYAGLHQLLARIDLSRKTGVYLKVHYIPETGFNKTALDGRFATDGKGVMAHVRGGADAHDANTLFWALASMGTGKNVVTLHVEVNRAMERVPKGTITQFKVRSMASKTCLWVPRTLANLLSAAEVLLKETLATRKFVVSKVDVLLHHHQLQVRGRKSVKVEALVTHVLPLVHKLVEKGWSATEVVRQITSMALVRPKEDDKGCCRQWLRAVLTDVPRPQDRSSDLKARELVTWISSLPEDSTGEAGGAGDEIVAMLIKYRFVAPKIRGSGLMLQSVSFRRHSGIGRGVTMSASKLEYLWCKNPFADRAAGTGVRVLQNSRSSGMYNCPIVKHKSEEVRTRTSKVEERVQKAKRMRRRELEKERIHEHLKAAILAKKLLSDGCWCRLPGCTRFFQYNKCRLTHERRGDQCSGGLTCFRFSKTSTNRDTDRCILINQAIADAHTDGRLRRRTQKKRQVLLGEEVSIIVVTGEYESMVTGVTYLVSPPVRGCMRKSRVINVPIDDVQRRFLMWAWNVGEVNRKKKLSSRNAAKLMQQHGTVDGQLQYVTHANFTFTNFIHSNSQPCPHTLAIQTIRTGAPRSHLK
jgi:hypothetical protein